MESSNTAASLGRGSGLVKGDRSERRHRDRELGHVIVVVSLDQPGPGGPGFRRIDLDPERVLARLHVGDVEPLAVEIGRVLVLPAYLQALIEALILSVGAVRPGKASPVPEALRLLAAVRDLVPVGIQKLVAREALEMVVAVTGVVDEELGVVRGGRG